MSETGESHSSTKALSSLQKNEQNSQQPPDSSKDKINRRGFISWFARATGGAVAATMLGSAASPSAESAMSPAQEVAEALKQNEKRLVIDFFDLSSVDKLIEQNISAEQGSLADVLKNMGVEDATDLQSIRNAQPHNESEEKIVLLLALKSRYQTHGDTVVNVGRKVAVDLGVEYEEPEKKDATSSIQIKDFTHDEIGNPILNLFISDKTIEEMVEKSEARDVGLSLETGEFNIKFQLYDEQLKDQLADIKPKPSETSRTITSNGVTSEETIYFDAQGNKISKEQYDTALEEHYAKEIVLLESHDRDLIIEDGYAGEKTYENLIRMVNLAEKFPDKNFFVAGGNPRGTAASRPDIREARKRIVAERGKMPENLMVIGVKGQAQGIDFAASLGCDIYVDGSFLEKIGFQAASSYATPIVKEVASILADKHLDREKVKSALRLMSNSISADGETIDVLDIEKIKSFMQFLS